MPQETDRKMMEILRILADRETVLGAKTIAEELRKKGYDLGERAVRYHMRILDEKGFTERIGYAGREITEKGLKELQKGLIYDQVDFIFSKFEDMIYQTTLNPTKGRGNVVVNTSTFQYSAEVMEIIKEVFGRGIAVSPFVKVNRLEPTEPVENGQLKLESICGTTIDGMLLGEGIPVIPQYGGLVKIEDYVPIRFTELIAYKKTSMTPLEAFTDREMTSVLQVAREGSGLIPANFRVVPQSARERAVETFQQLEKIGVYGLMKIGESGESVLGVPVDDEMVGIAVIGGIAPLCAAKEAGFEVNIKMAENTIEFTEMNNITTPQPVLKRAGPETKEKVKFLLQKAWNLIYQVDFDLKTFTGKVITNISYLKKEDLDDALDIFNQVMSSRPEYCTSKYFQIISDDKSGKCGIATVCSLTIDGILTKNCISTVPQYGGILETEGKSPRFIELTAYSGSSLDPHEIYLSKGMTSVLDSVEGRGRILASLREVPYVARQRTLDILEELEGAGFSILKVGKPSELVYNAKVERYHAGIVAPGGLNPIAAVKEQGIHVEAKAVEKLKDVSQMEEF
jgi:HTH-type transcriptional regulator, global nitrogen regulator NrpRI